MDIMHKFFTVARKHDALAGGLHEAKISSAGPRILDLGCGTGIWAIDMAEYVSPCVVSSHRVLAC